MAQPTQPPRPVVRGAASLQPDVGRRQLGEELLHLVAADPATQNRLLAGVDAMQLKDMLGSVQANPDNPHRAAPLLDCTITAWHYRCRQGPSTPTFSRGPCSWIPGLALSAIPE